MGLLQIHVAVQCAFNGAFIFAYFYYIVLLFFTVCILILYIITIVRQSNFSQSNPDF